MRLRTAQVPGLPDELAAACLDAAILAPSVHNTQPWRFRVGRPALDRLAGPPPRVGGHGPTGPQRKSVGGAARFKQQRVAYRESLAGRRPRG